LFMKEPESDKFHRLIQHTSTWRDKRGHRVTGFTGTVHVHYSVLVIFVIKTKYEY
jgi:hypothetical protein